MVGGSEQRAGGGERQGAESVIPAKARIHAGPNNVDSRFRGNDEHCRESNERIRDVIHAQAGTVIPAQAGIHVRSSDMDPRLRVDDGDEGAASAFRLPPPPPHHLLSVRDLGLLPYARVLELQRELARERITGELGHDVLLLVEHPPVVTLGRKAQRGGDGTAKAEFLAARGVELFEVERGGDATFHGPGQLVGYPILNLEQHRKDLHWYLRALEEVLIRALGRWGIDAGRAEGLTGVWTHGRKIASIGVHARGWVTWHGFALNVTNDLGYFDLIVPCGIQGVVMTSVERELGADAPSLDEARSDVVRAFRDVFGFAAETDAESAPERLTASHSRIAP